MRGVELEIIPVTKDALVFLVNVENPVNNISLSQLRDVYTGGITGWRDLGGANKDIIPYQRPADSGSQTLFLKLLMDGLAPMDPPSQWVMESMGALVESVSNYDNSRYSIGYSMFYYVNNMNGNDRFRLLSVDGVNPTRETIAQGDYPLEDCYYAVMRSDTPEDSPARKLVDWLLGDEGQRLAIRAGYIPIRPIEGVLPDDAIDPIYLGDTENSSGTGGTVLKTGVEDAQPSLSVRRPLSDMFFDGFNYISYINNEIMAILDSVDIYGYMISFGEEYQKRPFPGIPNDYPHYEIYYTGGLVINFPDNNPFFKDMTRFSIRLTEDISPYGAGSNVYSVTYDYGRRMTPLVDLYTLSVDIPDRPDVAGRINRQLQMWTDSLPGSWASFDSDTLDGFIAWFGASEEWPYRLQPTAGLWGNYLSVNYYLSTYDGPAFPPRMIFTISFDIRTGDAVELTDMLSDDFDYSGASFFVPVTFDPSNDWAPRYEYMPEGYTPPRGSVITAAWAGYTMNLYVTEPGGRVLQASFSEPWIGDQ